MHNYVSTALEIEVENEEKNEKAGKHLTEYFITTSHYDFYRLSDSTKFLIYINHYSFSTILIPDIPPEYFSPSFT